MGENNKLKGTVEELCHLVWERAHSVVKRKKKAVEVSVVR